MAPKTLKSKFITPKTDATKEIQAWANEGSEEKRLDVARQSGKLSDNVTEERMLESKILELSKERYKFLMQNHFEKKVFLDKQKRKCSVMTELMKGIDAEKYLRKSAIWSTKHVDEEQQYKYYKKPRVRYRGDRKNSTDLQQNCSKDRPQTTHMPKIDHLVSARSENTRAKTVDIVDMGGFERLPDLNRSTTQIPPYASRASMNKTPSYEPDIQMSPRARPDSSNRKLITPRRPSGFGGRRSAKKRVKSGGPTRDPRYRQLENSLSVNYVQRCSLEIPSVIQKIDTLHLPPKYRHQEENELKMIMPQVDFSRGMTVH
ncbi:uncharacterized protein LOC141904509 [Tubulanus polymorphus]|uniref:uncharacterized protein LOC141904509 n=1 Tax=Tubulanus polymorphus TaxID=672921 RepID=UPI003DA43D66